MSIRKNGPSIVWQGRYMEAVVDGRWEYVRRRGCSGAVGVIAVTDSAELVLVEQYRPPIGARAIEIPAGLAGDHGEDEPFETTAQRELLEETGFQAARWKRLLEGTISAGLTNEVICIFLATGLEKVHDGGGDDHEEITVHLAPLDGLEQWLAERIADGRKVDVKVHLAAAVARAEIAQGAAGASGRRA